MRGRAVLGVWAALVLSACDNAMREEGGGGAAGQVSIRGVAFDVDAIVTEEGRRHAPLRFPRVEGHRAHLMAWPRERFVKLETLGARAPFDVAFLGRSGRVRDLQLFAPGSLEGITSREEAAYALLVAPGTLGRLGVKLGDPTEFSGTARVLEPTDLPLMKIGEATAYVELALTESEREHGLMFRPRMSTDEGMLFAYPDDAPRRFWMGNTLIPLDIAFFRADGTLVNVNETATYPDPRRPPEGYTTSDSSGRARYVLEMNLGWFRRKGLVDATGRPRPGLKAVLPPELQGP